jgi:hypothetical protein
MATIGNPRGWSKRFEAAKARSIGNPVRDYNNAVRHAHQRQTEIKRDLADGKITQDDFDAQMVEIEEVLTRPEPGSVVVAPVDPDPSDVELLRNDGVTPLLPPPVAMKTDGDPLANGDERGAGPAPGKPARSKK